MSQFSNNVSIYGLTNSFRKLSGPATASTNSLTFSTYKNKSLSITVSNTVIIREVSIYTRIGDWNHIDYNNKFQIIVANTSSIVYNNYIGWQSSWNASASTFNYYSANSYNPNNLFNSTPIIQKLPLDIKLNPGSYEFYLDEFFASNQNLGFIMTTTNSNYPYTDPKGNITISTSSNTNQMGWTASIGNIFFNWIVADEEELIVNNGNFNISNTVAGKQSIFSINSNNLDLFSIENKDLAFAGGPISATPSFVINPNSLNNSTILNWLDYTGVDGYYNRQNNKVLVSNSSGVGSWTTYSNSNVVGQFFNFWNTGTTSNSDFIFVTISNLYPSTPTYSYLANLNTSFSNNYTYQIIDNSSYSPIIASISFYDSNTNSVTSNYYAVISGTNSGGPSVAYPGWKIIII